MPEVVGMFTLTDRVTGIERCLEALVMLHTVDLLDRHGAITHDNLVKIVKHVIDLSLKRDGVFSSFDKFIKDGKSPW